MVYIEANACMSAFRTFCEEEERNKLASSEEHQFWVFERGYLAAMQEVAKVILLRQNDISIDLSEQLSADKTLL